MRFFSPPEKPSFRWRSPNDGVHAEPLHPFEHREPHLEHRAVLAHAARHRLPEELDHRDTRDLLGVLKGQEHPGLGAYVGRPGRDVLAPEADGARRHLVGGVPQEGARQGRLTRPVRAHQGVELAFAHGEVHPAQDLGPVDGHVQALDFQKRGHAGSLPPPLNFHYGRSDNPVDIISLGDESAEPHRRLRPGDLVGGSGPVASPE